MKFFAAIIFQSTFGNPNDWKIASRPKTYTRPIESLKYDFSGRRSGREQQPEPQKRVALQRFSSDDFQMMTEDVIYKIVPSTDVAIRITATIFGKIENCADERLSIIYENQYWSQCGSEIFPSSPSLPEVIKAGSTLELYFPPNLSSWKFEVEWGQMRMIEENNDFDLDEGIEKLREMEKHIIKVLKRVNIRPYAFKHQMTTINQMIASTNAGSCLVPFEYNHYGSGRFQSWFAENERFSGNPCKVMDAFQTGVQRLAMEFACLDGIPEKISDKWEDKMARLTDRVC